MRFRFWQGALAEEQLVRAEELARGGKNRGTVRDLHGLRGGWHLERGEWALALESLTQAVSMARAVARMDASAEAELALARFHLGQLTDPHAEAEQLARAGSISSRCLADLWLAIGDRAQAAKYALAAYRWAWADGERMSSATN